MGRSMIGEFEQLVLLAILRIGDAAYAVSIIDEIQRCTKREVSQASAYVVLGRLEEKGFVTSKFGDPSPERGGRAKRYYCVTPKAIELLRNSREALLTMWDGLEPIIR